MDDPNKKESLAKGCLVDIGLFFLFLGVVLVLQYIAFRAPW